MNYSSFILFASLFLFSITQSMVSADYNEDSSDSEYELYTPASYIKETKKPVKLANLKDKLNSMKMAKVAKVHKLAHTDAYAEYEPTPAPAPVPVEVAEYPVDHKPVKSWWSTIEEVVSFTKSKPEKKVSPKPYGTKKSTKVEVPVYKPDYEPTPIVKEKPVKTELKKKFDLKKEKLKNILASKKDKTLDVYVTTTAPVVPEKTFDAVYVPVKKVKPIKPIKSKKAKQAELKAKLDNSMRRLKNKLQSKVKVATLFKGVEAMRAEVDIKPHGLRSNHPILDKTLAKLQGKPLHLSIDVDHLRIKRIGNQIELLINENTRYYKPE